MKLQAPAAARNREPILAVLREVLPAEGKVLEIASGSGEHAVHFARALPGLTFQPSDPGEDQRASIEAHRADAGVPNLLPPLPIDARDAEWGVDEVAAILCINMIHIAPWQACEGLFAGARRLLAPGAPLVLYGPFRFHGVLSPESNVAFDASLRQRNPAWGVRDLDDLDALARDSDLARDRVVAMPANNHVLVYRRNQKLSPLTKTPQ